MALPAWPENKALGITPCVEERDSWQCPNMKPEYETYNGERYSCEKCGKSYFIDDDEMR